MQTGIRWSTAMGSGEDDVELGGRWMTMRCTELEKFRVTREREECVCAECLEKEGREGMVHSPFIGRWAILPSPFALTCGQPVLGSITLETPS